MTSMRYLNASSSFRQASACCKNPCPSIKKNLGITTPFTSSPIPSSFFSSLKQCKNFWEGEQTQGDMSCPTTRGNDTPGCWTYRIQSVNLTQFGDILYLPADSDPQSPGVVSLRRTGPSSAKLPSLQVNCTSTRAQGFQSFLGSVPYCSITPNQRIFFDIYFSSFLAQYASSIWCGIK